MNNHFRSVSVSHKTAPLEVREQISLEERGAKELMSRLKEFFDVSDVLVVSTCNRTEIYYTSPQNFNNEIIKLLLLQKGITTPEPYLHYFEKIDDSEVAVRHLFEVATGLHSQVVGDMQIPNQIKHSYQWSADLSMAGPFLHRLMHTIFFANKKVAQETSFRDGAASVSYATVELVESLMVNPKILIVGLGEMGTDITKNFKQKNNLDVTLINRTFSKSEELAEVNGFRAVPMEFLSQEILEADVIISSVSSETPLITKSMFEAFGGLTFKYLIDLSVPRSVEAEVEEIAGIVLYNIDAIHSRTNEALERRIASIPHVQSIIDEAVFEFNDWSKEMMVSPTIQKLKNALEQIRQEEMSRFMKGLSDDEAAKMDRITSSMMQKIIKLPVLQLKAACQRGEAETLIDVLNDLFNLEKQSASVSH